jgi:hypothetical protein
MFFCFLKYSTEVLDITVLIDGPVGLAQPHAIYDAAVVQLVRDEILANGCISPSDQNQWDMSMPAFLKLTKRLPLGGIMAPEIDRTAPDPTPWVLGLSQRP